MSEAGRNRRGGGTEGRRGGGRQGGRGQEEEGRRVSAGPQSLVHKYERVYINIEIYRRGFLIVGQRNER